GGRADRDSPGRARRGAGEDQVAEEPSASGSRRGPAAQTLRVGEGWASRLSRGADVAEDEKLQPRSLQGLGGTYPWIERQGELGADVPAGGSSLARSHLDL